MLLLHHLQDALQVQEGSVAFVEVEDGRILADGLQHTDTADTEHETVELEKFAAVKMMILFLLRR